MAKKVALITGGASGMGLETAKVLQATDNWKLHLFDLNPTAGEAAMQSVPGAEFHQVNVTDYESLSKAFQKVFDTEGCLDFVFANAGIVERHSFYEKAETKGSEPPPAPNMATLDVNMNAVVTTTYLAMHYMRLSPHKGKDATIVATASCGGLYPSQYTPVYAASKAGVVNLVRSLAFPLHHNDGIKIHAICPGTVRTNLLVDSEWNTFPAKYFTPVDKIASTVKMLADGGAMEDVTGRKVAVGEDYGLAVEIHGTKHYFRDHVPFCDDDMRSIMMATSMENQQKAFDEVKERSTRASTEHVETTVAA